MSWQDQLKGDSLAWLLEPDSPGVRSDFEGALHRLRRAVGHGGLPARRVVLGAGRAGL